MKQISQKQFSFHTSASALCIILLLDTEKEKKVGELK